jgi:osmotically-inducible protein OsmY
MAGGGTGYRRNMSRDLPLPSTPAAPDEPPDYAVERLRQALADDVAELGVQVTMAGGDVFLHGHVGTAERREAITEMARHVLPEHRVHNQTTVGAFPEDDGQEEVR